MALSCRRDRTTRRMCLEDLDYRGRRNGHGDGHGHGRDHGHQTTAGPQSQGQGNIVETFGHHPRRAHDARPDDAADHNGQAEDNAQNAGQLVLNPVQAVAALAREHDALTIVDAVTSIGGMPLDVAGWGLDVVYSCSQKCLGAPSGLSPIVFTPRALARKVPCRSFYFDVALLEDYWVRRKYHHTMSASLEIGRAHV